MSIYMPSKELVFIHIPKTGGTSVEKWLLKNAGGAHYIGRKHDDIFTARTNLKNQNLPYFTICRNPYARLVSWYNFRIKRHKEDLEAGVPLKAADKSLTHEMALEHYGNSFEKWLKRIDFDLPLGYNFNFAATRKQISFIDIDKKPKFILRCENLNNDFKKIQNIFDKHDPLLRLNRTNEVDWKTYYKSEYSREFVYKNWKDDFEYFNYEREIKW